jgi:15-cis-phytoene desaturase
LKPAPTVAILGGGMGGLACAHELARAGLRVTVWEASDALGGKAKSQYLPGTGTDGRRDLPGEHGFRFYPAFYRHTIATMREIHDPLSPSGTVAGNLVAAPEAAVALDGLGVITTPRKPRTPGDVWRAVAGIYRVGGTAADLGRYLGAHLKYLTACEDRRDGEIEAQSWATFIGADRPDTYGDAFREVLLACTRTMVAMDAERGSSRTVGRASSLLLADSFRDTDVDRTMMGPTSECWIEPWQEQLRRWGVTFRLGHRVSRLDVADGRIARAWVRAGTGEEAPIEADAFVLAVPLEVAHRLVTPALADADPALAKLARVDIDTTLSWMIGAQFFLGEDLPLCEGHLFFPKSPWSLTAISQGQFWNRGRRGMDRYGDGRLRGILSVDVSSCFSPDADGLRVVDERTREGILRRVLAQLLDALDRPTARRLERAIYAAHLDDEVRIGPTGVENAGRLLVHPPGSWHLRPSATLTLPNLFLAADYVQTSVDLASMEGANEAGRRAARGVLRALGLDDSRVKLFTFAALDRFDALKAIDRRLHRAGLPHLFDLGDRIAARLPRPLRLLRTLGAPPRDALVSEPSDADGPLL